MLSKNYNYLLNGATASKYNSDLWFRYLRKMITKDGIKLSADDIQELTSSNQLTMYQKATLKEAVKIDSTVYKRVISQDEKYVPRHLKLALKRIKEKQNEMEERNEQTMEDKFKMTRKQNVFYAKRNIVDYIWKSANLEGIGVTYPETQVIYDGGVVNGLKVDDIIAINNLKYAWQFVLENDDVNYDYKTLCFIHKLVADKLVMDQDLGCIRTVPVNVGGTKWKPDFPIESQIKEELSSVLNQPSKSKTEVAIETMLYLMRKQMFIDGNKRAAMLFANKIMIDNGCGIITIDQENQAKFYEKLINYYESNNMDDIKKWVYEKCIDGQVQTKEHHTNKSIEDELDEIDF